MDFDLPKGITIGHAHNSHTGVTVILSKDRCVCGCEVRGGAPGTRETDLLNPVKMMDKVDAIALCGGSAYGLDAVGGIMDFLCKRRQGYEVKAFDKIVPIVPAAVIFDLIGAEYHYPNKEMGLSACQSACIVPAFGAVGVGKGATVGKIRGIKHASKGGIGAATVNIMGINVTAVVAVNAFGDIYDHVTDKIIAGARDNAGGFLDTNKTILNGQILRLLFGFKAKDKKSNKGNKDYVTEDAGAVLAEYGGANTTIGCIITDAKLDKIQANKLASIGHNGLAKSIKPVHTDYDGDTLFCMATGRKKVLNFVFLQVAAVEAVAKAVAAAVRREV